jgi:predicted  nucleic acid-binding Zn-ribbon protein
MEIKSNEILDERVKAIFQKFLKDLETLFQELENRELEIRKELKELKIKDDELEARLQDIKNKKNLNKEK